jgi:hypothetical protein
LEPTTTGVSREVKMKDNFDEKKWKRFDIITNVIAVVLAVMTAETVKERFFEDNFWIGLIFTVIAAGVFAVIQELVLSIVEHSEFLNRPFLKK